MCSENKYVFSNKTHRIYEVPHEYAFHYIATLKIPFYHLWFISQRRYPLGYKGLPSLMEIFATAMLSMVVLHFFTYLVQKGDCN